MAEKEKNVITLEFIQHAEIKVKIDPVKSPLTLKKIASEMPLVGRGRFGFDDKKYYVIRINLKYGTEKSTMNVKQGDVVYCARLDAVIIVLDSKAKMPAPVNVLGKVKDNLDIIKSTPKGTNVKIFR